MDTMVINSSHVLYRELKAVAKESRDHIKGCQWLPSQSPQSNQSSKARPEFLSLRIIDILGQIIPSGERGRQLVHCGMFSSIPGLYPLDASNIPLALRCDNQKCLQTLPNVFWGTKSPLFENYWSKKRKGKRVLNVEHTRSKLGIM